MGVFEKITLILVLAAALGALGLLLKQPLIVTFIAVGVLVGPSAFGFIETHHEIHLLAELGIALLLFVVGLKLDLHMIRTMGPVALATGVGQVIFTSVFGFLICLALGLPLVESIYVAVALTFSSTIIIVKLLTDKREIDALHGRIAIGFLIVQDIGVVIAMIALSAGGAGSEDTPLWQQGLLVAGKGVLFLGGLGLLMRFVLPGLLNRLARSSELLVLFSIAWAVLLAAAGDVLGFSKEVGAFLAGVSIASTPYREAIGSRLVSLRDFLLLFFFIDLGARLDLSLLAPQLGNAALLSLFVLIGNPLIVLAIMGFMGYRRRTGFLAGLTVAQISEFSLILAALGLALGHIQPETMGLITLVGIITIGLSTYAILYSGPLYERISPLLRIFERAHPHREIEAGSGDTEQQAEFIVFGLGQFGGNLSDHLHDRQRRVIGVDFDPEILDRWRAQGRVAVYGDADDPELLEYLPLHDAEWVVSTVPGREPNMALVKALRRRGFEGHIVLTARTKDDDKAFQKLGVDLILHPMSDAAEQAVDALSSAVSTVSEGLVGGVDVREVRLPAGSCFAGRTLADVPLRAATQTSVMAVSRAGHTWFDPGPDFMLFPGDRLVLFGEPDKIQAATEYLARRHAAPEPETADRFAVLSVDVAEGAPWIGRTLAELSFRRDYGASVVGIERGERQIPLPGAGERLCAGDKVFIAGEKEKVKRLKAQVADW